VSHRRKVELGADALAILLEESTFKLSLVVRNDTAWDPKSADNRLEESNSSTLGDTDHMGSLWPLCQLVDGDEEETVPADSPGEWPQDIHPRYGEWSGGRSVIGVVYVYHLHMLSLHVQCNPKPYLDSPALLGEFNWF
jgi:hypothetical protein